MLTGPVVEPSSGKVRNLTILLHGYGSNADDFAWGLRRLSSIFPDTAFIAPNAPTLCDKQLRPDTYQWFPITTTQLEDYGSMMYESLPLLETFIYKKLEHFGLGEEDLIIGGFSQGAMMAIGAALSLQQSCAGVLAYSGAFVMPKEFEIRSRPKVLLIHGNKDTIVPYELMHKTKNLLEKHELPVETITCNGVGHSINLRGFTAGKQFIENAFSGQEGIQYGTQ